MELTNLRRGSLHCKHSGAFRQTQRRGGRRRWSTCRFHGGNSRRRRQRENRTSESQVHPDAARGRERNARSLRVAFALGGAEGKEITMRTHFGHAAVALALVAGTQTAAAQQWNYTPDRFENRAVVAQPLPLTQAQRTIIYRTIIPQGRGRGPIVREQIITEPVAPAGRWCASGPSPSRSVSTPMPMAAMRRRARRYVEPEAYGVLRLCGRYAGACRARGLRRCRSIGDAGPGGAFVSLHGGGRTAAAGRSGHRHRRGRGRAIAPRLRSSPCPGERMRSLPRSSSIDHAPAALSIR